MKKAIPIAIILLSLSVYVYLYEIVPARAYDPIVRGFGTIESTQVSISPKLPGRIEEILADEGDMVKADAVLVKLGCEEYDARKVQTLAQVEQAKAARAQAMAGLQQAKSQIKPMIAQRDQIKREYDRIKKLFESHSVSQNQYEKVETAYQTIQDQISSAKKAVAVAERAVAVADSQIELAKTNIGLIDVTLAECAIKAPIGGRVSARNYEPGEIALPGAVLLKVDRMDEVHTWIYVPNNEIGRVRIGQKVKLIADTYPEREFFGNVAKIKNEAEFTPKSIQTKEDRTRLVYGVKVVLTNESSELLPGMPVEAELLESEV